MKRRLLPGACVAAFLAFAPAGAALAQINENFPNRQAIIINNGAPNVSLSGFDFANTYSDSRTRLNTDLKWTNTGSKAITAFEVVVLYFDPFNQPMPLIGGRWLIPGHNSANWTALQPGQADGDGLIAYEDENAYTAVVYVRAIRFEDGSVWYSNQAEVAAQVKTAVPTLTALPSLDPEPKPQAGPR